MLTEYQDWELHESGNQEYLALAQRDGTPWGCWPRSTSLGCQSSLLGRSWALNRPQPQDLAPQPEPFARVFLSGAVSQEHFSIQAVDHCLFHGGHQTGTVCLGSTSSAGSMRDRIAGVSFPVCPCPPLNHFCPLLIHPSLRHLSGYFYPRPSR